MVKHDWYLDDKGEIDVWRLEVDPHNGPQCKRCRKRFCEFCNPEIWEEECPSGQLAFEETA